MDYSILLVLAILFAFYYPIFSALADTWLIDPYYSHGFIIPVISLYVVWMQRKHLKADDRYFMYGAALTTAGLAAYGYGILNKSLYISSLSFLAVSAGIVLSFYGKKNLVRLLFPILFLVFMIPLPYMDYASTHLQTVTASASTTIIKLAGIPAVNHGSQIEMGTESVFVIGEPCSGLRTMISLFALAAVFSYYVEGPAWKRWALFASSIPIAVVANILRVVLILFIAYYYGEDLAMSLFHDASSLFLFLLAFVLLVLISRLLGCKGVRNISR